MKHLDTQLSNDEIMNNIKNAKRSIRRDKRKQTWKSSQTMANQKLDFLNGKSLGDVNLCMEDGHVVRKIRRFIERSVCKEYYRLNKSCPYQSNRERYTTRHQIKTQMRYIYGSVPECHSRYVA